MARILAAKPHSADVERLVSSYNVLKTPDRNALAPETMQEYLYVMHNMPPLVDFDVRPAVKKWLSVPRRESTPAKATQQEWFVGVFAEAIKRPRSDKEKCDD